MKNHVLCSRPRLAALLCMSMLFPIFPRTAAAQNKSQITVEVGQPNIWSLGQAHYLLANMRERSRDLGVKVPTPTQLDPSSANGTRMNLLRTLAGAEVNLDTVAGAQNAILGQRFDAELARFTATQNRLDALTGPYTDAVREVSSLTVQLAALPADKPELGDQRKQLTMQLAAKTAERDALKSEMDVLRQQVTAPSAPTAFKGSLPTTTPSALPDDLKDMFNKLNATVATPQLNASTTLENYIQMQYEVIAKQLTLLRDEVGPDQRLVFLEMPMSLYSVPKTDDDYVVRLEWNVNQFFGPKKSTKCTDVVPGHSQVERYTHPEFVGEPIDLKNVRADLRDILQYITDQYRVAFVIDPSVRDTDISVNVENIPWNKVLNTILKEHGLGMKAQGDNLLIATLQVLAKKAAEPQEQRATEPDEEKQLEPDANQNEEDRENQSQGQPITLDMLTNQKFNTQDFRTKDPSLARELSHMCWGQPDRTKFRVIDIIPRQSALNVNDQHGTQKGFALTARFLTMFGMGGQVSFQRQRSLYEQFIQQEVYASAYGKGMSNFGWTFGPLPGTTRLAPGVRTTYAVLAIPRDALALELKVAAKVYRRNVSPTDPTVKPLDQSDDGYGRGTYRILVPNERTEGFWVDRVAYTPVEKGKQATTLIEGKYFSPLTGILVNGVPLKRVVSIAKNESPTANLLTVNAVDPTGEYEYLNPQQLILSFRMDTAYVGTPLITLVTPEKTAAINFFKLDEINFRYKNTSLTKVSEVEPMFGDTFEVTGVDVVDDSDDQYVTVDLHGRGLRRDASIYIGPRPLDRSDGEVSAFLSTTVYRIKFRRPAEGRAVAIKYRNTTRQVSQEASVSFQQTIVSNYEIIRYDPAGGGRNARLDLVLTVSGQDAAPRVEIERRDGEIIDGPVSLGNHKFRLRIIARRDPVPLTVTGVSGITRIFDIGLPTAPSIASVVNAATNKPEGPAGKIAVVTLRGSNLRHVVRVLFGGKEATIMQVDPEVILVNAPTGEEGPVQILLETNVNLRGKVVSNIADFRTQGKAIYTYTK